MYGGAVGHGGVDDLALAGAGRADQGGGDAQGKQHSAATHVAEEIQRDGRVLVGGAERAQRTCHGDVVDVVTGSLGQRPVLTPAGHPAVDQLGITGQARLRAEAQALGDTGAEALDERVGAVDDGEDGLDARWVLEVEGDRAAAPVQDRVLGGGSGLGGAVDADDFGALVGEEHAGEGPRADAAELDDTDAGQRSCRG